MAYRVIIPMAAGGRAGHRGAMRTRLVLPTVLLAVPVLAAGCAGPDPLDAEPVTTSAVAVADNVFAPVAIEVPVGSEVLWTWEGSANHNVVGEDFESELKMEGTFSHTFEEVGDITYICTIHPAMRGAVRVVES